MSGSFGARLRELRRAAGVSQRATAEAASIDFTYLSKIENGHMPPPGATTLRSLAQVLDADEDELFVAAGKVPPDLAAVLASDLAAVRLTRVLLTETGKLA